MGAALDFRIAPAIVVSMLEMTLMVSESLQDRLAIDADIPEDDEDLRDAWLDGLREELKADCNYLLDVLGSARFGQDRVELDDGAVDGLLRASSAIRLKLRESVLRNLPNEALETGEVDYSRLPTDQQRAYACFQFLASLQGAVLWEIDPQSEEALDEDSD